MFSPMLSQLKSSGIISHYLLQKSLAWRKSLIDATLELGRFLSRLGQNRGPFDALSAVCLVPAPQEECLTESWHDSRRGGCTSGKNRLKDFKGTLAR